MAHLAQEFFAAPEARCDLGFEIQLLLNRAGEFCQRLRIFLSLLVGGQAHKIPPLAETESGREESCDVTELDALIEDVRAALGLIAVLSLPAAAVLIVFGHPLAALTFGARNADVVAWALQEAGLNVSGLKAAYGSNIPTEVGLGSAAAVGAASKTARPAVKRRLVESGQFRVWVIPLVTDGTGESSLTGELLVKSDGGAGELRGEGNLDAAADVFEESRQLFERRFFHLRARGHPLGTRQRRPSGRHLRT